MHFFHTRKTLSKNKQLCHNFNILCTFPNFYITNHLQKFSTLHLSFNECTIIHIQCAPKTNMGKTFGVHPSHEMSQNLKQYVRQYKTKYRPALSLQCSLCTSCTQHTKFDHYQRITFRFIILKNSFTNYFPC